MDPSKFDNLKWNDVKHCFYDVLDDTENLEWVHPTSKSIYVATKKLSICYITLSGNIESPIETFNFPAKEELSFTKDDFYTAMKSLAYYYAEQLGLTGHGTEWMPNRDWNEARDSFINKVFPDRNSNQISKIETVFLTTDTVSAEEMFNYLQTLIVPSEYYKRIGTGKIAGIVTTINSLCPNEKEYLFEELGVITKDELRRISHEQEVVRQRAVARAREEAKAAQYAKKDVPIYVRSNIAALNDIII